MTTFGPVGEHGQGGITRRADGRLQVSLTMPNGRRLTRYVPRDADVKRQRRKANDVRKEMVDLRDQDLYPSEQTLAVYLRSWIAGLPDGRKPPRPRTIEHYRYVVEGHVIPGLGAVRLDRLTSRMVQEWVDRDSGAVRSVHHHRAVLRHALNVAVRRQVIPRNPATAVDMPALERFRGNPLTAVEARALLAVPGRLAPLWRLAVDSGLRISELLGLAWDDVDLEKGELVLRYQLFRDHEGWHRVEPKTQRDEPIHLAPSTVRALREHRTQMAADRIPAWQFHGLVFVTPAGMPFGRSEVLRAFHAACDAAGIPRRRVHDLRGTSLTILEDEGISEAARMRRAGHVTVRMARHYAQGTAGDLAAAEAIERVLG